METESSPKVAKKYMCKKCDYTTSKRYNFSKHLTTAKHRKGYFGNVLETNGNTKVALDNSKICGFCDTYFTSRSGLWKHKIKCSQKYQTQTILNAIQNDSETHKYLMEQNKQLIDKIIEQNEKLMEQNNQLIQITNASNNNNINTANVTNTINNNNNNNNKFNINMFLNETCKDAISMNEFINSLPIGIKELEDTARLGYSQGISKIFIDGLNNIDISKRPVHCGDLKRAILYIKDDDQWVKDNENKDKIINAIRRITTKNIQQIAEWQKANPEYRDPDSKVSDRYMKLVYEVMSGVSKEEQEKNYQKIIRNILKEVVIDKRANH
uniref:C2H2-type domain-containing protein n=1 Tax=viral metagenome TaxID=1070528 RepID=A0A6C0IWB3_9ZZZZ